MGVSMSIGGQHGAEAEMRHVALHMGLVHAVDQTLKFEKKNSTLTARSCFMNNQTRVSVMQAHVHTADMAAALCD